MRGGEVRRRPRLRAPKMVEEKPSTKAQIDQAADCRQSSGRVKIGEMSPELIKSVLHTALRMFSPDESAKGTVRGARQRVHRKR